MAVSKQMSELDAAMADNLPAKTGHSLDAWLAIVAATELRRHGQIVSYLKSEHGIGHGYADLIARRSLAQESPGDDELLEHQYRGREAMREIGEEVLRVARSLGDDVEIAPKKSYVSLRRNRQFAIVQPSTKTRIDVGLVLRDTEPTERLEAAGSFNSMMTHRVRVTSMAEVDDELRHWLRAAFETS